MKVSIDKDLCIGCGLCESNCPDIFGMEENFAIVKIEVVPARLVEAVKQMASDCPVAAIKINE